MYVVYDKFLHETDTEILLELNYEIIDGLYGICASDKVTDFSIQSYNDFLTEIILNCQQYGLQKLHGHKSPESDSMYYMFGKYVISKRDNKKKLLKVAIMIRVSDHDLKDIVVDGELRTGKERLVNRLNLTREEVEREQNIEYAKKPIIKNIELIVGDEGFSSYDEGIAYLCERLDKVSALHKETKGE